MKFRSLRPKPRSMKYAHRELSYGIFLSTSVLVSLNVIPRSAIAQQLETPPTVVQAPIRNENNQVERGRYIAIAADCVACHTSPGNGSFAGGYKLVTPFGAIFSSNITPDKETGIGSWTREQFEQALRKGKGSHGNLYPAMPYTAYAKMTDQDVDDLWAYMKSLPPVKHKVIENQLPFPFNIRLSLIFWNWMFFNSSTLASRSTDTNEVRRGRYLVEALEHCGTCHTTKNALGGDKKGHDFQGARLQGWFAPDITPNDYVGLGTWTTEDIVSYLKTGTNRLMAASGPMTEAIVNSTQHLTEQDLHAIAAYLKTVSPSSVKPPPPVAVSDPTMRLGKRLYETQCQACHISSGEGVRHMIPALARNPAIQAQDPSSLVNVVLKGGPGPATQTNPTGAAMPGFDWKLSDSQIAAVLTYIRNSWGNAATVVSADTVGKMRKLQATTVAN